MIEVSGAEFTVNVVEFVKVLTFAEIVVLPPARDVASPWMPALLLIVATDFTDELHNTDVVRLAVLPPVNVPVATNCCVAPLTMEGLTGVTAIELKPVRVPVPVRDVVCGLPLLASSLTVRVPFRALFAVGVKVTLIAQEALLTSEVPQVLV